MRRLWLLVMGCCVVGCLSWASVAQAERVHVVAKGHTLGRIAKRYNVTISAICEANAIERSEPIHPGQKLIIPDRDDRDGSRARGKRDAPKPKGETTAASSGMHQLGLPGGQVAYYFEPTGPGRLTLRPVIMYLHGRGGNAAADCARWAAVARRFGWVMCPQGPETRGGGRGWNNNWATAQRITMAALQALRDKYGRRVQLYGNTLVGFSEGAFAAMNIGVREPRAFNRWLILGGTPEYWGGPGRERLSAAKQRLRRVYLITGERDSVVEGTRDVGTILRHSGIATQVMTPNDMGHELPLERKASMYVNALSWLSR